MREDKREGEERGNLQKSTNEELVYRSTLPKLHGWERKERQLLMIVL